MAKIHQHLRKRRYSLTGRPAAATAVDRFADEKFKQRLKETFFVRFHMTLILIAVVLSGVSTSKLMLELDVNSMLVRYPIAVCIGYGIFFLSVKLWLWYVGVVASSKDRSSSLADDIVSGADGGSFDVSPSGGSGSNWGGFGGGSSGGGGASDSWGEVAVQSNLSSSGGSGSGVLSNLDLPDVDLGDEGGCLVIVLLALLAALLFGIFGAGVYLIFQSPVILTEAAFQAALAAGLIKVSRRIDRSHWAGSVFRATRLSFVTVLTLALCFGWAAHHYCPAATKAAEVFTVCKRRT